MYVRAHGDEPRFDVIKKTSGLEFEKTVASVLAPHVDEVRRGICLSGAIEIEIAVRCGNQVGIIEAKSGTKLERKAIDQLNTAAQPQYLGTYTGRFWVRTRQSDHTTKTLDELARHYQIEIIEVLSCRPPNYVSPEEAEEIVRRVRRALTGVHDSRERCACPRRRAVRGHRAGRCGGRPGRSRQPIAPQVRELVDRCGLSGEEWQCEPIVVNLPSLAVLAAAVVAELHGRMGYFPTVLSLRPAPGVSPRRFELGEVVDLRWIRESARYRRTEST